MKVGIFISYRRDDARQAAGRLGDSLESALGRERIFRDIEDIPAGSSFADVLNAALAQCTAMLVVIGPAWLSITDSKTGLRRLDQPEDWIRAEIVAALARKILVIPVLIDGATQPTADDLPEALKPLAGLQSMEVADKRWRSDVKGLVEVLSPALGLPAPGTERAGAPPPAGKGRMAGAVLAAALIAGSAYAAWKQLSPPPPEAGQASLGSPSPLLGAWVDGSGQYEFKPGAQSGELAVVFTPAAAEDAAADAAPPAAWPSAVGTIRDGELHISGSDPAKDPWECTFTLSVDLKALTGSCMMYNKSSKWSLSRPG